MCLILPAPCALLVSPTHKPATPLLPSASVLMEHRPQALLCLTPPPFRVLVLPALHVPNEHRPVAVLGRRWLHHLGPATSRGRIPIHRTVVPGMQRWRAWLWRALLKQPQLLQ